MPQISVIIPTFNRERFVTKAIDSVLKQDFRDYEIIVIDDGSADGTQEALGAYSGKISYIYQRNSGVSAARNAGIKAAKGRWVAFLDSDDEWTEDHLRALVTQIEMFPHAVGHTGNVMKVSLDGEIRNHFAERDFLPGFKGKPWRVIERPLQAILEHELWWIQSSVLRKDVLLEAGIFDTGLSIAEDLDVIGRVALRGAFTYCSRELVRVFRREEMIENLVAKGLKDAVKYYESFGRVCDKLKASEGIKLKEKWAIASICNRNWRALGNILVLAGKRAEARHYYGKSLLRFPSGASLIKLMGTFSPRVLSRCLVRKVPSASYENGNSSINGEEILGRGK